MSAALEWGAPALELGAVVALRATWASDRTEDVVFVVEALPPAPGGGRTRLDLARIVGRAEAGRAEVVWTVALPDGANLEGLPLIRFRVEPAEGVAAASEALPLGRDPLLYWTPVAGSPTPLPPSASAAEVVFTDGEQVGVELRVDGLDGATARLTIERAASRRDAPFLPVVVLPDTLVDGGLASAIWSVPPARAEELAGGRFRVRAELRAPGGSARIRLPASSRTAYHARQQQCPVVRITNPSRDEILALSDRRVKPQTDTTIRTFEATDELPVPDTRDEVPATKRTLVVTGTVTGGKGDETVVVNQTTVRAANFAWTAEVSLAALGTGPFPVRASCGASVDQVQVSIVRVEIQAPVRDGEVRVSRVPRMPTVDATAKIVGHPGDPGKAEVSWELRVGGYYPLRIEPGCPFWVRYGDPDRAFTFSGTAARGAAWQVPWRDTFVGGWARLVAITQVPGRAGPITVRSDPRWFAIRGDNPGKPEVYQEIDRICGESFAGNGDRFRVAYRGIICHEAGARQFDDRARRVQSRYCAREDPEVKSGKKKATRINSPGPEPEDRRCPLPTPFGGQPVLGIPAGMGVAQIDPAPGFPGQHWDWRDNIREGLTRFDRFWDDAGRSPRLAQTRINAARARLIKAINTARRAKNIELTRQGQAVIPLLTSIGALSVPAFTPEQYQRDAVRRYNTGSVGEYFFDAAFAATEDGLGFNIVDSSKAICIEGNLDGSLGAVRKAPEWKPQKPPRNPTYVDLCLKCPGAF